MVFREIQGVIREMQPVGKMRKILNTLKGRLSSPVAIIGWLTGSIVTSLVGPFSTYEVIPLGERLLFWTSILFIAVTVASAIQISLRQIFPSLKIIRLTVLSCSIFILLYWFFILITISYVYSYLILPSSFFLLGVICGVTLPIFAMIYLLSPETLYPPEETIEQVAAPSVGFVAPIIEPSVPNPAPESNGQNRFLQKFLPESGNKLIRLAMRDHYLEVFTETGQKLLHMRFSDALQHVAGMNGEQIHRSHWINFDEITDVVRQSGKIGFRMSDGVVVPIARSRKSALKDRGLL